MKLHRQLHKHLFRWKVCRNCVKLRLLHARQRYAGDRCSDSNTSAAPKHLFCNNLKQNITPILREYNLRLKQNNWCKSSTMVLLEYFNLDTELVLNLILRRSQQNLFLIDINPNNKPYQPIYIPRLWLITQ